MKNNPGVTILRWGLAFVFFYAAIAALLDPQEWAVFLPGALASASYARVLLAGFSAYQLILAGFLFSGKKTRLAAIFATVTLAVIVAVNIQISDIVFRDVGLAFASLALFEMSKQDKNTNNDGI